MFFSSEANTGISDNYDSLFLIPNGRMSRDKERRWQLPHQSFWAETPSYAERKGHQAAGQTNGFLLGSHCPPFFLTNLILTEAAIAQFRKNT